MSNHDDMRMREWFENASQPLPDAGFSAAVMRKLDGQERAGRILAVIQGGTVLGLGVLLLYFLKAHLLSWIAHVPGMLAQHPWWLVGLLIVVCLLPSRSFKQARPQA